MIYTITFRQFESFGPWREIDLTFARRANQILMGEKDGTPLCFIGLEASILSDFAYVWMITTLEGEAHSKIICRHSRGMLARILEKYDSVSGHCFGAHSSKWLTWLGAKFTSPTEFKIERQANVSIRS